MFYEDWHDVKKLLARGQQLCDDGGDWERKNRLKVRARLGGAGLSARRKADAQQRLRQWRRRRHKGGLRASLHVKQLSGAAAAAPGAV